MWISRGSASTAWPSGSTACLPTSRVSRRSAGADRTFQPQIADASEYDIVIAIFWSRIGSALPESFARMPDGKPYPSGTAFEVLNAIEARRKGGERLDIYVFRKTALNETLGD